MSQAIIEFRDVESVWRDFLDPYIEAKGLVPVGVYTIIPGAGWWRLYMRVGGRFGIAAYIDALHLPACGLRILLGEDAIKARNLLSATPLAAFADELPKPEALGERSSGVTVAALQSVFRRDLALLDAGWSRISGAA